MDKQDISIAQRRLQILKASTAGDRTRQREAAKRLAGDFRVILQKVGFELKDDRHGDYSAGVAGKIHIVVVHNVEGISFFWGATNRTTQAPLHFDGVDWISLHVDKEMAPTPGGRVPLKDPLDVLRDTFLFVYEGMAAAEAEEERERLRYVQAQFS
jgi:hypothetical protein